MVIGSQRKIIPPNKINNITELSEFPENKLSNIIRSLLNLSPIISSLKNKKWLRKL